MKSEKRLTLDEARLQEEEAARKAGVAHDAWVVALREWRIAAEQLTNLVITGAK